MESDHNPSVGSRITLNGYLGTIKYIGPVENTQGIWLGVEWDNPERGKHNGSKDGKQYFTCRFSSSGSFIRPNSHIIYGVSFLHALSGKYIENLRGSDNQETIILGSSNGSIQVEAVSLDKIRERFSRLDMLREVSLENAYVATGDPAGYISKKSPKIRGLDLSENLLPSWEMVTLISRELVFLERLSLNRNRLQLSSSDLTSLTGCFTKLKQLELNDTMVNWTDMREIISYMPQLQAIEIGYNRLSVLRGDKAILSSNKSLEVLNLDTNFCSDWIDICASLSEFQALQRVVLTCNQIKLIPFPNHSLDTLPDIKYISLSQNQIATWESIDALSCWFPGLESLTIAGNPLVTAIDGKQSRPILIARIPSLTTLDGASISSRERIDSELFYMSTIVQHRFPSDEEICKIHIRWQELCKKYGKPDELPTIQKAQTKLSNHLIDLQLFSYTDDEFKDENAPYSRNNPDEVLHVLPTMTLHVLRLKIRKTLKLDNRSDIKIWLQMEHGSFMLLDDVYNSRSLDWLGVGNGSQIKYELF